MGKSKRPLSKEIGDGDISKSKQSKMQPSINVGEDILTEILLRLPVKSVLKFQTVSKLWLSIVSTHRFRQNHASRKPRSAAAAGLLFKVNNHSYFNSNSNFNSYRFLPFNIDRLRFFNFPAMEKFSISKLSSSCYGLLLLEPLDQTYCVYNPITKESKVLDIPERSRNNKVVCASLAFDPSESLHFKVIFLCLHDWLSSFKFHVEVYSSATGEFKVPLSNSTLFGNFDSDEVHGVFCNGAIHWITKYARSIVYFNVHNESINAVFIPSYGRKAGYLHFRKFASCDYFGESKGHLYFAKFDDKRSVLNVYELIMDYSEWFLKYKVELASIASTLPQQVYPQGHDGTCLSIIRGEEEDDLTLVLFARNEWVEYNFKKKTARRLCKFQPNLCTYLSPLTYLSPHTTQWFNTHQIIPTLTCI